MIEMERHVERQRQNRSHIRSGGTQPGTQPQNQVYVPVKSTVPLERVTRNDAPSGAASFRNVLFL